MEFGTTNYFICIMCNPDCTFFVPCVRKQLLFIHIIGILIANIDFTVRGFDFGKSKKMDYVFCKMV